MKLSSLTTVRPLCFFILLVLIVLLIPSLVIPFWITKVKRIDKDLKLISHNVNLEVLSEIEKTALLLSQMNSSATMLATVLTSSLDGVNLSFSTIETYVAPILFQALSTIPKLSQISYIGSDGLFFSYYTNDYQTLGIYSNSSFLKNMSIPSTIISSYKWYTQPVNQDTGELYGEAISSQPLTIVNASWFQQALVSTNGYVSLETGWGNSKDLLFLNTVGMDKKGAAISLGFPVKSLIEHFYGIELHGGNLYLATKDGKVLAEGIPNTRLVLVDDLVSFELLDPNEIGAKTSYVGNVTCKPNSGTLRTSMVSIWETEYMIYCSLIDIVGVKAVYVVALPHKGLGALVDKDIKFALLLLILMVGAMVVSIVSFVFFIVRASRREMYLCATLIKQMEATQQAERKNLNKSQAFASASHDIRASLAGITGLIEMCREEVAPASKLDSNLLQMDACTKDLLGLLNSILDSSKIEAGKMQLEEEELDLAQLLEDIVDLFHPVGMKKGIDVVLDPCDGSFFKFSKVKGDRTKLIQILCNLLNNAIKFTSEGHVTVRAWAKKPSTNFDNSIFSSSPNSFLYCLSCLFLKEKETYNGLESMNPIQGNANIMDFVFEVDDTGQGIPKEKQSLVFENYIQVKDQNTTLAQEGTGLGLGIVKSLVSLMGGEIRIVDKVIREKGTCFRFNILLTTCETINQHLNGTNILREEDVESSSGGYVSSDSFQPSRPSSHTTSPKLEGSHVVLFIQSHNRQRISQKYMESMGIRVSTVKEWQQLSFTLKKLKQKLNLSNYNNSSGRLDLSSRSDQLSILNKDIPLSSLDGINQMLQPPQLQSKRTNQKGVPKFIMIVIDTSAGPFRELSKIVAEFRRDLYDTCCRIIWIDKPGARNIQLKGLDEDKLPPSDLIISKPFHGSRLYHVIGLLPEFGGTLPGPEIRRQNNNTYQVETSKLSSGVACHSLAQLGKTHEYESLSNNLRVQKGKVQIQSGMSSERPLSGMKVLVVDDNDFLRMFTMNIVVQLGADVELCENGEKALELVCKNMGDQMRDGSNAFLPYDYILMDCQMPVMDGFEATRRIREKEANYGIHLPIIALTAHTGEEAKRMKQAGMDFHLGKPLQKEQLMEAIVYINNLKHVNHQ